MLMVLFNLIANCDPQTEEKEKPYKKEARGNPIIIWYSHSNRVQKWFIYNTIHIFAKVCRIYYIYRV